MRTPDAPIQRPTRCVTTAAGRRVHRAGRRLPAGAARRAATAAPSAQRTPAGAASPAGVLEATVVAVSECRAAASRASSPPGSAPCIGPDAFEVGADVLRSFGVQPEGAADAVPAARHFRPRPDAERQVAGRSAGLATRPPARRRRSAGRGRRLVHGRRRGRASSRTGATAPPAGWRPRSGSPGAEHNPLLRREFRARPPSTAQGSADNEDMAKKSVARQRRGADLAAKRRRARRHQQRARAPGRRAGRCVEARSPGSSFPAEVLAEAQRDYLLEAGAIWNRMLLPGSAPPALNDRRFASPEWTSNPATAFLAEMYLLNARTLLKLAESVDGDAKTQGAHPLRRAAVDRRRGAEQLPRAQSRGAEEGDRDQGREPRAGPRSTCWTTSSRATSRRPTRASFEVGRNVATTEGAVVFENELFQLIEYKPLTRARCTSGRSCSCRRASTSSTSSTCSPRTR